jgi:uncharacterized membrane protein YkvA (DUF1232 family)
MEVKMELSDEQKRKAIELSETLANDFDPQEAETFATTHQDQPWYENFVLLLNMLLDKNFSLQPATWAIIAGAIAYVIMPIDIIPDFIPFVGWIDDIFVLKVVTDFVSAEIDRYRSFSMLTN